MEMRTMKVPVTVPTKTLYSAPAVFTSVVDTMSVSSFVSIHGNDSHSIPTTSTEAAVSAICGNAEKSDLKWSEI